jgi:MFS family permease
MRGRLAGLEVLSYGVGPVLGQVRGGAMAGVLGVRFSLACGGVACVLAVGATCAALPRLWQFDRHESSFATKAK